jgi:hypothetical protein
MRVEDRCPIAARVLRHVEVADHLHLEGLAFLSGWRLEREVSNVIQCGFLICGSHDSAASYVSVHHEAVIIDHKMYVHLNSHAIVFLTNLEGWYGRSLFEFWLTAGQLFERINVRRCTGMAHYQECDQPTAPSAYTAPRKTGFSFQKFTMEGDAALIGNDSESI